jgi:hypothetical protein
MVNSRPHMPKTPSAPPRGRRSRATSPGRDPDPDPNGDNPTRTKSARAAFLMAGLELRPFRRAAPRFDLCATSIDREGGRRNFAYQILRARWRDGEIVTRLRPHLFFRANGRGQLGRRRKYGSLWDRTHETAGTAPLLVAPPQVRTPSIEGPAPPAALCEATASSDGSPTCLGAITAGQRHVREALRGQLGPASLAVGGRSEQLADVRSPQA